MKKRLMVGLMAGGLVAAMLPGVASAGKPQAYESYVRCNDNAIEKASVSFGWPPSPTDVTFSFDPCFLTGIKGSAGIRPLIPTE